MNESHEFTDTTHFTAGTVGAPGQREFFIQLGNDLGHVSVKVEKLQVKALAQFLRRVLTDMPTPTQSGTTVELKSPSDAIWAVGQIAVGIDESDSKILIILHEREEDQLESFEEALASESDLTVDDVLSNIDGDSATIRASINVELAADFVATANELMTKGRPSCRLCGQPVDPEGHSCPRLN